MAERIAFDRFTVDLETRELSSNGRRVLLQDKPFRLLVAFLERPGRVIERAELYDALWPADLHVDREAGLNTAVRKLRFALRELSGGDGGLVETVPRVGYRLAFREPPPPAPTVQPESSGETETAPARISALQMALGLALAAVLSTLGVAILDRVPDGGPEPMPQGSEQRARYVEARALLATMDGDLARARDLLRILSEDLPDFAPAHAYLAEAGARLAMHTGDRGGLEDARRAAQRARELDPESAVAHRVLAMIALNFDWDVQKAGALMARALHLDPEDPIHQLASAAYASALGRHQEAIAAVRRAVDLEPDSMAIRSDAGYFLLRAGRPREAAVECEMVLRLDPENVFARDCLLTAYSSNGDVDAARSHAVDLLKRAGAPDTEIARAAAARDPRRVLLAWRLEQLLSRPDPPAVRLATHHLALGDRDSALTWLEQAARERSPLLVFVPHSAESSRIRGDPRYQQLLRDSGLDVLTAAPARGRSGAGTPGIQAPRAGRSSGARRAICGRPGREPWVRVD